MITHQTSRRHAEKTSKRARGAREWAIVAAVLSALNLLATLWPHLPALPVPDAPLIEGPVVP